MKKKWWKRKRWWLLAGTLLLVYPTVATLMLWTGMVERLLRTEDLRVEIENPAYSIIPGHIELRKVGVYMNAMPQFVLKADDVSARIRILPLFQRRLSLSWLGAENVSYRMRLPRKKGEVDTARTRAFPPLHGLPGLNAKAEEELDKSESSDPLWTVHVENVDVRVRDLWFFEYHYVGDGRLRGGFERGPDVLRVATSVQDLGPGRLYFGEKDTIAENFGGQLRAEIPEVDPSQHADLSFFDFVKATADLDADVKTLKHVSAYIPAQVSEGAGPLNVLLELDQGKLADNTRITFETDELNLQGDGWGVKTDWSLDIEVSESDESRASDKEDTAQVPRLTSKQEQAYVSWSTGGNTSFTVQLLESSQKAALMSSKIGEDFEVRSASVSLPKIISKDLDDVAKKPSSAAGTDERGLVTHGGEAEASLLLNMDDKQRFHGPFRARFSEFDLGFAPLRVKSDGQASFQLSIDPANETIHASDISFDLRRAAFLIGNKEIQDWWYSLEGKKLFFRWSDPARLSADASFKAKDAEPLMATLAESGKVPKIVDQIVNFRNIEARAELLQQGEKLDIMLENIDTNLIDFNGRIYQDNDTNAFALLIGGRVISLGIVKWNSEMEFEPFAHAKWLNAQLAKFPPPIDGVTPPQP